MYLVIHSKSSNLPYTSCVRPNLTIRGEGYFEPMKQLVGVGLVEYFSITGFCFLPEVRRGGQVVWRRGKGRGSDRGKEG